MRDFDYKYIDRCQYAVPAQTAEGYGDCGNPAIANVWFFHPDGSVDGKKMPVCAEHLNKFLEKGGDWDDVAMDEVCPTPDCA